MKKLLMLAMVLVMFAIVGCGGGSSKNMFTEQGELVRIMDELKNKDGFKGHDLLVFQDISLMHFEQEGVSDSIDIYIVKPGTEDVDNYKYSNGKWEGPNPVQLTGDGRMEDNVTPMSKIDFSKVPDMYKQLEAKAKDVEGGKVSNLLVYILGRDGMYASWGVEGTREKYNADFDLNGNLTSYEKQ
ncbi:hypothetical protein QUV93_00400 [Phascolarctobacterium faecium]|nr:hypothetical protein [Phascolarctobacterium faecium]MDM8108329.1 hypothetical protein [Phascolarctobacterium faecium]CDB34487.1 putative uncharacterized protein [Phascolarctobacterium sp. CAG:266]